MIVANPIPRDNTLVEAPSGWNPEVINVNIKFTILFSLILLRLAILQFIIVPF